MEFWDNIQTLRSLSHCLLWVALTLPPIIAAGAIGSRYYVDRRIGELSAKAQAERETKLRETLAKVDDELQRERYRIKSLEMRVTLFLTSENNLLSDVIITQVLSKTTDFTLMLSKVDKHSRSPQPKENIQLISKKLFGPYPVQDNQQDFGRFKPYKVVSVNQLLDASDQPIIGKSVEELSDFNQLIMRSPHYDQPADETPQFDELKSVISSFWYSINKVYLQLMINGVSVNDMTAEVPRFQYMSNDSTYFYWWKLMAVEALFQDVRSRYEQAGLFQSDNEGRTTEDTQVK